MHFLCEKTVTGFEMNGFAYVYEGEPYAIDSFQQFVAEARASDA